MGRKKRPAAAAFNGAAPPQPPAYMMPPPPAAAFDQYGRPLPPPMPPNMMQPPPPPHPMNLQPEAGKRQRVDGGGVTETGERTSFPVKKYRPDSYYKTIEAFQKYTKSHRMDATYVKWTGGGATPEKPEVYGIRIAGSFLSWGRGKTRDGAIDAAVRAAFALVAAHGYNDFPLTDDCFTEEPAVVLAPMPPPPPPMLPPGAAPLPPGLPPGLPPPSFAIPPSGAPPNFALPPPPADGVLIPQPSAPKVEVAVASAVGAAAGISSPSAIGNSSVTKPTAINIKPTIQSSATKKDSKNKLVFLGEDVDEAGEELSMEELRMRVPRYWNKTVKALAKRKEELVSLGT